MKETTNPEEKLEDVTGGVIANVRPEKLEGAPTIASVTPDGKAVNNMCCLPTLVHAGKVDGSSSCMPFFQP
jgi:hypothetical protein